jgi:hypothetical protein
LKILKLLSDTSLTPLRLLLELAMERKNWITLCLEVPDIEAAIDLYVNTWMLFEDVNKIPEGRRASAILEFIDSSICFRLGLFPVGSADSEGQPIPSAKNARISLPKSDFWTWVDTIFSSRDVVESTPWSADVILRDPFGHMFVIYTTESPK